MRDDDVDNKNGTHLRLSGDLYPVESVGHRVDDNEDVTEFSGNDAASVVPRVLRPHDVHLVVAKVANLSGCAGRSSTVTTYYSFLPYYHFPAYSHLAIH